MKKLLTSVALVASVFTTAQAGSWTVMEVAAEPKTTAEQQANFRDIITATDPLQTLADKLGITKHQATSLVDLLSGSFKF